MQDTKRYVDRMVTRARRAVPTLATASTSQKNAALEATADALLGRTDELRAANEKDLESGARVGLSRAMLDRLTLTDARIAAMAQGLRVVAGLPDPVGRVESGWRRPNGLEIERVRVPIGVILMIYESRPNVTADAAGLCLKSSNVAILRGGKEAIHSSLAIHAVMADCLEATSLPRTAVQLVDTPERAVVGELLTRNDAVDLVIPRGGKGLIERVTRESRIPVIKHYEGICHTFVDADADVGMALSICMNAKVQRPGVCNAMETLLVHERIARRFLPKLAAKMREAGVELRGCPKARAILPGIKAARKSDWATEYLDLVLSIRVVAGPDEAIEHIEQYGSHHSDAIVTRNYENAQRFTREVDSSAVFVNCSTRFNDGGQFGLGAEIGISTDRLHARGPMGLEELTIYKYVVRGDGQVRE